MEYPAVVWHWNTPESKLMITLRLKLINMPLRSVKLIIPKYVTLAMFLRGISSNLMGMILIHNQNIDLIQFCKETLLIISCDKEFKVSESLSTTFLRELNTSFLKPIFPNFFPNLFDRVHLRSVGLDKYNFNIFWNFQTFRFVPSRTVTG